MNAKELERLLLLEQSGELSLKQRQRLDAELAASAEARRLQGQLRGWSAAIPAPAFPPAPDAAQRIAARLRKAPRPAFTWLPAGKPALAAAAALALLLGVRAYQGRTPAPSDLVAVTAPVEVVEWIDPLETEFTELESLLTTISSDDSLEITEI